MFRWEQPGLHHELQPRHPVGSDRARPRDGLPRRGGEGLLGRRLALAGDQQLARDVRKIPAAHRGLLAEERPPRPEERGVERPAPARAARAGTRSGRR